MNKPFLIALTISIVALSFLFIPKIRKHLSERTNETTQEIDHKYKEEKCIDVVMEILTTSPTYLEETEGLNEAVVKNGGTGLMVEVEGSPNPESDYALGFSNTYDFCLLENYPDHSPTIARFTFNPTDRQLYKFDDLEDELIPIEFNRNLLVKLNEVCR